MNMGREAPRKLNACVNPQYFRVEQELASIFYKGPDNQYLGICRPFDLCCGHSAVLLHKIMQTLKKKDECEFHSICAIKYYLSSILLNHLKKVKPF